MSNQNSAAVNNRTTTINTTIMRAREEGNEEQMRCKDRTGQDKESTKIPVWLCPIIGVEPQDRGRQGCGGPHQSWYGHPRPNHAWENWIELN